MTRHPFFHGVVQREVRIGDRSALVPLLYPRLCMMGIALTVDAAAAQALLPTRAHRLWRLPGGRALAAVHCFEYQDTGIGPYNEVALTLAVDLGGSRLPALARAARAAMTDVYHGFIVDLPVTTEVALAGGLELFHYPKYLARIDFTDEPGVRTCRLADRATGELILEVRAPRLATTVRAAGRPAVMEAHSYPVFDGVARHARFQILQRRRAWRAFPRGVALRLGSHPRAGLLGHLRPGRPLHYVYVPDGQGILYLPEPTAIPEGRS